MSWRTVYIKNRAKLEYRLGFMVVRNEKGSKEIYLGEISTIIVENTAVSITAALLNEITKNKINLIFCDEKRQPSSKLCSLYGSHDSSRNVRKQVSWSEDIKDRVWTDIVREKIKNQSLLLERIGDSKARQLEEYKDLVTIGDSNNMEGVAARVYFSRLFGKNFTRKEDNYTNAALDYGYSIILASVDREITANGNITQLGINHSNVFNHFNLGSDFMEPLRPFVDEIVFREDFKSIELDDKVKLLSILDEKHKINGRKEYFNNAISIYVKSLLDALNEENVEEIKFIEF